MVAAPTITPPVRRAAALDVARALAVIGVVINHAVDGLLAAGYLSSSSVAATTNEALYLFRMPALALLLGLFIPSGVRKSGTRHYIGRRVALVLYLYLLWRTLQLLVEVAASGVKNYPRDPTQLLMPWVPTAQLWFLPFLAVATVVVALAQPWRSAGRAVTVLVGLAALSLLTWGHNPDLVGVRGLALLFFSAVGAVLGLPRASAWVAGAAWKWATAGTVGALAFGVLFGTGHLLPSTRAGTGSAGAVVGSAAAASCGIVVVLALAVLLARCRPVRAALSYVGARTLPVFLAHVVVVAGARVILGRGLGVTDPLVLLALEVPLGVGVPLLLAAAATRTVWLGWLFESPFLTRSPSREPGPAVPAVDQLFDPATTPGGPASTRPRADPRR